MRKAVICSAMAVIMTCFGLSTYAATSVNSKVTGNTAEIQITSDYTDGLYTIYILKPNKTVNDIKYGADAFAGVEEMKLSFGEGKAFGEGVLSFTLPNEYGTYSAIIGGGELSGKEIKLPMPDPADAANPVSEIKKQTASSIDGVLTNPEYNGTYWYADTEKEIYKSDKNAVMTSLVEILKDGAASGADVTSAYNEACVIASLKTCGADEFYDTLFMAEHELGVEYADEAADRSDSFKNAFISLRKTEPLNTSEDLQELLDASEAVSKLNTATRDTIIKVIESNNDIFGLNLKGDYKRVDKYTLKRNEQIRKVRLKNAS